MEALEVRSETVLEWIDDGRLLWVWDIALPSGSRRTLRFWLVELLGEDVRRLSREQAIDRVIGCADANLTSYQVEQILFVRRSSVHRAVSLGELNGRVVKGKVLITRESLVRFLGRRVACLRTGRNFVGIEKDPKHFATAVARLEREINQCALL